MKSNSCSVVPFIVIPKFQIFTKQHKVMSTLDSTANPNISDVKKKTVRFTPDTLVRRDNSVATTISKHVYEKDLGYTQYHIQVGTFSLFVLFMVTFSRCPTCRCCTREWCGLFTRDIVILKSFISSFNKKMGQLFYPRCLRNVGLSASGGLIG